MSGDRDLRAELVTRMRAGDPVALACAIEALPDPLPLLPSNKFRDAEIAAAVRWLREVVPGISNNDLGRIIASAGEAISRSDGSMVRRLREFPAVCEMAVLIELRRLLQPVVFSGRPWPGYDRVRKIVNRVGRLPPVETTQSAGR